MPLHSDTPEPAERIALLEARVNELLEANNLLVAQRQQADLETRKLRVQLDSVSRYAIESRLDVNDAPAPAPKRTGINALTRRQADVLSHIAAGYSNKAIAHQLRLSEGTVKIHVTSILKTLGVRTRSQAALVLATGNVPAAAMGGQ